MQIAKAICWDTAAFTAAIAETCGQISYDNPNQKPRGEMMKELFTIPQEEEQTIRVISLWMPWALWVMWGWKPIETRIHDRFKNLVGQRIGIHAAQKWDTTYEPRKFLTEEQWNDTLTVMNQCPRGVLLGTVNVDEARWLKPKDAPRALIECETRRFGLILSNPDMLKEFIPMKGLQGIWKFQLPTTPRAEKREGGL